MSDAVEPAQRILNLAAARFNAQLASNRSAAIAVCVRRSASQTPLAHCSSFALLRSLRAAFHAVGRRLPIPSHAAAASMKNVDLKNPNTKSSLQRFAGPAIILLAAFVAIFPQLIRGNSCGHDFNVHLVSWLDCLNAWRHGILYPHWASSPNYGAGEPRFVYYPPLTWMLGAALGANSPVESRANRSHLPHPGRHRPCHARTCS